MAEIHKGGTERKVSSIEGVESLRQESLKKKAEQLEQRSPERGGEKSAEQAKHEALELATKQEKLEQRRSHEIEQQTAHERQNNRVATKAERKKAYDTVMTEVRGQMSAPARSFSKLIHNPVVEKTSEAVGSTVARPNAVLSGSVSALILVLAVYSVARIFGYPLSGFETIAAFILGWIIGILYDFFKTMITGKAS